MSTVHGGEKLHALSSIVTTRDKYSGRKVNNLVRRFLQFPHHDNSYVIFMLIRLV